MGLTKRKRYPNTASRRKMMTSPSAANMLTRRTPISVVDVTPGDTTVVVFDQPVIVAGIPQWPNNSGHMPESAELTGPEELTLNYPAADTTTTIVVPFESAGVRNGAGGYVLPGTFPIS